MARARLEWNGARVTAALPVAKRAALTQGSLVLQVAMKRMLSGVSPSAPGSPPGVDRGGLRRSIAYAVGSDVAQVGTELKYGLYLERGANPRAKGGGLPVPVNHAAKRMLRTLNISGGMRVSLRTKNLVLIKRKGKPPLLIEQTPTGKEKKNGAVFVLKKSVRIAARPWAVPSFASSRELIAETMRNTFAKSIAASLGGAA